MLNLYFIDTVGPYAGGGMLVAANDREHALALARSHCIDKHHGLYGPDPDSIVAIETPVIEGVLAENTYL